MNLIAHTTREILTGSGQAIELRANAAHAPRTDLITAVNDEPIYSLKKVNQYLHVGHGWVNVYHVEYEPQDRHWKWNGPECGYHETDAPI